MKLRYRVEYDHDYRPESPVGGPLPESAEDYANNPIMRLVDPTGDPGGPRRPATYAEYCAYEGNPDRHVVCAVLVDRQCPTCGGWKKGAASLWGIDFMDDSPEVDAIGGPPVDSPDALPGYLAEVARELRDELDSSAN